MVPAAPAIQAFVPFPGDRLHLAAVVIASVYVAAVVVAKIALVATFDAAVVVEEGPYSAALTGPVFVASVAGCVPAVAGKGTAIVFDTYLAAAGLASSVAVAGVAFVAVEPVADPVPYPCRAVVVAACDIAAVAMATVDVAARTVDVAGLVEAVDTNRPKCPAFDTVAAVADGGTDAGAASVNAAALIVALTDHLGTLPAVNRVVLAAFALAVERAVVAVVAVGVHNDGPFFWAVIENHNTAALSSVPVPVLGAPKHVLYSW